MSLTFATLMIGVLFLLLGVALASGSPVVTSALRQFPRSRTASALFFGLGAALFIFQLRNLSEADFGAYRQYLMGAFGALAVLAFFYVPDFLAVRGLAIWVLVGAAPFLRAAYMEYEHPQRLLIVTPIYLCIAAAIWIGAQPWRMRDFLEWLLRPPPRRARIIGAALLFYGLVVSASAFTY